MSTPSPSPSPQSSAETVCNLTRSLKRRIAQLESQPAATQLNTIPKDKTFVNHGRVIHRVVSLFNPAEILVDENDRRQAALEDDDDDDEVEEIISPGADKLSQERNLCGHQELMYFIPILKTSLEELDPLEMSRIFSLLRKGADGARADDTRRLREIIPSWLGSLSPPLDPHTWANRGFYHHETGRLLCPVEYNWADADVRTRICDGHPNFQVTADSWPAFLYKGAKYYPEDEDRGFLKSIWLIKGFKYIFTVTSPTSAKEVTDDDDKIQGPPAKKAKLSTTKRNVAMLIGLKSVTPRSLAYTAVQVRFALSDASHWSTMDGAFDYIKFYNNIIDFFDCPPGPVAKQEGDELLRWWSQRVFGKGMAHFGVTPRVGTSVSKQAARRAACERRTTM